jgi:hypothetical protein
MIGFLILRLISHYLIEYYCLTILRRLETAIQSSLSWNGTLSRMRGTGEQMEQVS